MGDATKNRRMTNRYTSFEREREKIECTKEMDVTTGVEHERKQRVERKKMNQAQKRVDDRDEENAIVRRQIWKR
jgi:hypothetical protein